jgi:hypothetical protein
MALVDRLLVFRDQLKDQDWDSKMVVVVGRWSLFGCGGWLRFDCTRKYQKDNNNVNTKIFNGYFLLN